MINAARSLHRNSHQISRLTKKVSELCFISLAHLPARVNQEKKDGIYPTSRRSFNLSIKLSRRGRPEPLERSVRRRSNPLGFSFRSRSVCNWRNDAEQLAEKLERDRCAGRTFKPGPSPQSRKSPRCRRSPRALSPEAPAGSPGLLSREPLPSPPQRTHPPAVSA